ncbi:MAG: cytochrome c biogenesis protein ResB, partial [Clostridia bacterium]|nr:cytochrome c biogenesis protein ResB [Clostridia bacterium]
TERNETGFIEQYVSALTVRNTSTGETQSGTSSVNHPAVLGGYKFYQTASGNAARVTIAENGVPFESADLCVGEELTISFVPGLSLYLNAYEPDHNGKPAYQVLFFYNGQHMDVGKNYFAPGGVIDLDPYTITLSDPLEYTLLRVKKDSFAWLVLVGAILTALGLFLALYVVPETAWAVKSEDGSWTLNGKSKKLAPLFIEQFDRAVNGKSGKEGSK